MLWDKGRDVEAAHQDVNALADRKWLRIIILRAKCDHCEIDPCFCCSLRDYCTHSVSEQQMAPRRVFDRAAQREGRVHRKYVSLSSLDTLKVRFVTILLNIASLFEKLFYITKKL